MKKNQKMLVYQVFMRLFGNDNTTNQANGTIEENGSGKFSSFTDKALLEIKNMGFTHIWYTGLLEHATQTDYTRYGIRKDHPAIVKGRAGSPYAVKDYYDVNPDLADDPEQRMKEFEDLVSRTHKAGLQLVMDFIPNHVARQYHSDARPGGVVDLGENDNTHTTYSTDNNFYYIPGQAFSPEFDLCVDGVRYEEEPAKATGNDCFYANPGCNDWYETVKLNYGVDFLNGGVCHFDPAPDTWHKMLDILLFWAGKKIHAFRCDMAEMVPVEFWAWAIPQVKSKYPDITFIAEIYNPDQYRNYLWNGKFDYLYDKVGLYDTLRAIMAGKQSASSITGCWQSLEGIQHQMLNFLENHDEQRIASDFFTCDARKAVPAMIVAATMNTNPLLIYFGQELGERGMDSEGFSGKDGRTSIFDYWSIQSIKAWRNEGKYDGEKLTEDQKKLREFYITLLTLCNKDKAISQGLFYDLMYVNQENPHFNSYSQYAYIRQSGNELLLIVVNFADQDMETRIHIPDHAFEYLQFDPSTAGSCSDLITGEKINSKLGNEEKMLTINIKAHNGRILKYRKKK